jgi:antitoxin ParD1/3/4
MNVSLTKELEDYVTAQVKTGHYSSASEVVREAPRTHISRHRRAYLEARIAEGEKQVARGEVIAADEAYFEAKKRMIRETYMRS